MQNLFITSIQIFPLEISLLLWLLINQVGAATELFVVLLGGVPLLLRTMSKLPWAHMLKVLASCLALIDAVYHEQRRRRRKAKRPAEVATLEQRPFWSSITLWAALLAFIESVLSLF